MFYFLNFILVSYPWYTFPFEISPKESFKSLDKMNGGWGESLSLFSYQKWTLPIVLRTNITPGHGWHCQCRFFHQGSYLPLVLERRSWLHTIKVWTVSGRISVYTDGGLCFNQLFLSQLCWIHIEWLYHYKFMSNFCFCSCLVLDHTRQPSAVTPGWLGHHIRCWRSNLGHPHTIRPWAFLFLNWPQLNFK